MDVIIIQIEAQYNFLYFDYTMKNYHCELKKIILHCKSKIKSEWQLETKKLKTKSTKMPYRTLLLDDLT